MTPNGTPIRDDLHINEGLEMHDSAKLELCRQADMNRSLRSSLSSLPQPKNEYQIVIQPIKKMMKITNVSEYKEITKQKLPKMIYDYFTSRAEDQWTLKENRNAFSRIMFRPRVLIDVSKIDMITTVLGFKISMPIMIAPTSMHKMAHPEGEYATARAASAVGTIMTLSTTVSSSVEEVSLTGPDIRFLQLYVFKDRNIVTQLVRRAENASFKAIVLTIDTAVGGHREANIKNRFTFPPHLRFKNYEAMVPERIKDSNSVSIVKGLYDQSLNWKDVKWLQTITSLPIILKGVLIVEDHASQLNGALKECMRHIRNLKEEHELNNRLNIFNLQK